MTGLSDTSRGPAPARTSRGPAPARSKRIRLGAVGYLNARPLVYGLDRSSRFAVRYDVPSECARLLHAHEIDVGLIPSIEYLRGGPYAIVPNLAIASRRSVASVAIFTTKPIGEVTSIALDTSSRTSVALVRILCARLYRIQPRLESRGPDLEDMLAHCDAALVIGDNALFQSTPIHKIDLGEAWMTLTGLPFVWAFWAGRPDALTAADVEALQHARDEGVQRPEELARQYLAGAPKRQEAGARYLRQNIQYYLGSEELEGLRTFYRYATELGLAPCEGTLNFYDAEHSGAD
ncbi:MAG TPA: menaquinone biosynthesis protein [Vicinamibacterales bacterium]|nr:menaquinone biosynthesis protein [Vicinamibacterales bacterium]